MSKTWQGLQYYNKNKTFKIQYIIFYSNMKNDEKNAIISYISLMIITHFLFRRRIAVAIQINKYICFFLPLTLGPPVQWEHERHLWSCGRLIPAPRGPVPGQERQGAFRPAQLQEMTTYPQLAVNTYVNYEGASNLHHSL